MCRWSRYASEGPVPPPTHPAVMGNLSCSVSGLGAGDASRKSVRGSTRTCQQRRRTTSTCCHLVDNSRLIGHGSKVAPPRPLQDLGQVTRVVSSAALEELLEGPGRWNQNFELDGSSSHCVSPYSEVASCDSGGEYLADLRLEHLVTSLREDPDESDDDCDDRHEVLLMCDEDKVMMMLKRPTTTSICGEEWINWTALCPCCRRDASDDSIDLQEMIKLEPIRVRTPHRHCMVSRARHPC